MIAGIIAQAVAGAAFEKLNNIKVQQDLEKRMEAAKKKLEDAKRII